MNPHHQAAKPRCCVASPTAMTPTRCREKSDASAILSTMLTISHPRTKWNRPCRAKAPRKQRPPNLNAFRHITSAQASVPHHLPLSTESKHRNNCTSILPAAQQLMMSLPDCLTDTCGPRWQLQTPQPGSIESLENQTIPRQRMILKIKKSSTRPTLANFAHRFGTKLLYT